MAHAAPSDCGKALTPARPEWLIRNVENNGYLWFGFFYYFYFFPPKPQSCPRGERRACWWLSPLCGVTTPARAGRAPAGSGFLHAEVYAGGIKWGAKSPIQGPLSSLPPCIRTGAAASRSPKLLPAAESCRRSPSAASQEWVCLYNSLQPFNMKGYRRMQVIIMKMNQATDKNIQKM